MRRGRVEEADALAQRIGKTIIKHNKTRLSRLNPRTRTKEIWAAVRQLTGRRQEVSKVDGVNADSLNEHYARISTDAIQPLDWTSYQHGFCVWVLQSFTNHWRISSIVHSYCHCASSMEASFHLSST